MISINKRMVPLHCSVSTNAKYLAENVDGSWYAFSTIPIADDKEGEWILNPKLKRPGNKIMVFSAGLKYPDNPNWMKTLQIITDESILASRKTLKNLRKDNFVLLASSQIGIVTSVGSIEFRIDVLHDNLKFELKRNPPIYNRGWYYPSTKNQFYNGGHHSMTSGIYIGATRDRLSSGELQYEFRYKTVVNVISPDDIAYVKN